MEPKKEKPDNREYTIKIIPHQGETVKSFHMPVRVLKYAAATAAAAALIFTASVGVSAYMGMSVRQSAEEIQALERANGMQQEQITQLAKKASDLQDEMEKLSEMERELRRMSGTDAQDGETEETAHNGQGGPHIEPKIEHVSATLNKVEKDLAARRASLEKLKEAIRAQQERERERMAAMGESALHAASRTMPAGWPTSGEITSPFGLRWGGSDFHPGIDIANDTGTPIMATADGVVTAAGWNSGGYGNLVDISHGSGIMTRYGHASSVVVSVGQQVKRGQIIAYMGSTGFSTGPHLHYEVRIDGQAVNPASYL